MANMAVVEHGILTEQSDLRAHVCPRIRKVFVYPTSAGGKALLSNRYPLCQAHQAGINDATAEGCWIPWEDIDSCVCVIPRRPAWEHMGFRDDDGLQIKGKKALQFVLGMIKSGLFPLPLVGDEVTDREIQITGMDILVCAPHMPPWKIEVKCDWAHIPGEIFLQVRECNPLGIH